MSTFEIRGITLTEAGVKKFKQTYSGGDPIAALQIGFDQQLTNNNQRKLNERERIALQKWLYDTRQN